MELSEIRSIHGYEGIGIFWSIIETLREQKDYKWEEKKCNILAGILSVDQIKLNNILFDLKRLSLIKINGIYLYSSRLNKDMKVYQTKKRNGKRKSSGIPSESLAERQQGEESKGKKSRGDKIFTPPTIEEVSAYFKLNGFTEDAGKKAFEYYDVADWVDSKGSKIKNWKQKMQGVWFKDENKIGTDGASLGKSKSGMVY